MLPCFKTVPFIFLHHNREWTINRHDGPNHLGNSLGNSHNREWLTADCKTAVIVLKNKTTLAFLRATRARASPPRPG